MCLINFILFLFYFISSYFTAIPFPRRRFIVPEFTTWNKRLRGIVQARLTATKIYVCF